MLTLPTGLHGAYTRKHLLTALGRTKLQYAVDEGRLVHYARGILVVRERMLDFHTRCAAALLTIGPHAVLARETSARLHGCTAAGDELIHVLMPYSRQIRTRPDLVLHHGHFEPSDVIELDGLRCLVLEAAITGLLCDGDRSTALATADQALAYAPVAERAEIKAGIAVRIQERVDRRGCRQGHFLLDLTTGLPESPAESWLLLKIVDAGLPVPEPQHEVRDLSGRVVWRLDFAWPGARLALEYDGYEAHHDKEEQDATRDQDLRRRGWTVIRADVSDLRDPTRLFARLKVKLGVSERTTRGA